MPVIQRRLGTGERPVSWASEPLPFQVRERGTLEVQSQQQLWQIYLRQQYRHQTERNGELSG